MADVPLVNQADMVDGDNIFPKMRMIEALFKGNLKDYKRKMNSWLLIFLSFNVVVFGVVLHHYCTSSD